MPAGVVREAYAQKVDAPDAERLALLADASQQLADAGLEPTAVLERLCELVVPRLGHACQVLLLSEDGVWLNPVALVHTDPQMHDWMQRTSHFARRAEETPYVRVLRTGRAIRATTAELTELQRQIPAEELHLIPRLNTAPLLLLPLRAHQRPLGTLAVYRGSEGPPFEDAEQLLLQELADRAGLALDVARAYEAERRARHAAEVVAERLARLQRVTEALSEAITPADVARVIVEQMIAAIGADRAIAVAPLADEPGLLEVLSHRGIPARALASLTPIPTTESLPVAVAYRTGEPVWMESREALSNTFPHLLVAEPEVTRAAVALPLRAHGRTLGAIAFGFDTSRTFSPDERGLLLDLTRQSAQALERAWLYETARCAHARAERVAARTARLQTLNAALSQALPAAGVAEVVIDQGVAAVGAQVASLWLMDESAPHAWRVRSVGLPPEMLQLATPLPLGSGTPLDDLHETGQPVWLESHEEMTRRYPRMEQRVRKLAPSALSLAVACLPLRVDGRNLGMLVFGFPGVHRFDDDERVFLSLLAHHAAQALERARLFAQERKAREALREANHTLQTIVHSSPMAITLLEMDGRVRLWNPAAERIFGWKSEEVLGQHPPVVPEDKQEELREHLASIARGESILGQEIRRQRRDGTPIDVSLWATSVDMAGGRRMALSVLADITERKRAEAALRFLAEASTVLASSLDHEVTLKRVANLAVPTYADGCYVYLLGKDGTVSCVATARAEDQMDLPRELGPLALGESAVSRVITSGRPELGGKHSGSPLPLPRTSPLQPCEAAAHSYLCVPLLLRGQAIGALSFVSSRRGYDEQDLMLAQEMARHAALAIDNARFYREAREAIRLREEFISIASHELRTPITSLQLQVQGLMGALTRHPEGIPPERLRRGLQVVDRQVKRQMLLVNDLLDVSRMTSGQIIPRLEPMDLAALVREVADRFQQELVRTGSLLALHAPGPVSGSWDRLRLDQVVTNLISNAVKYGQGNPIDITVKAENGRAHLVVRDSGIGIAPEHLERVFGRFERAVSDRNYGGFGLGLWIARQCIEALGGHISVSSQLGEGSTFSVELPCEPACRTAE